MTLNTSLKRLFLSSTSFGSSGAIALAEFLPESRALLHLDLTQNGSQKAGASGNGNAVNGNMSGEGEGLGLAGVMALQRGLNGNRVLRCLDLDVPPGDEEFARSDMWWWRWMESGRCGSWAGWG